MENPVMIPLCHVVSCSCAFITPMLLSSDSLQCLMHEVGEEGEKSVNWNNEEENVLY